METVPKAKQTSTSLVIKVHKAGGAADQFDMGLLPPGDYKLPTRFWRSFFPLSSEHGNPLPLMTLTISKRQINNMYNARTNRCLPSDYHSTDLDSLNIFGSPYSPMRCLLTCYARYRVANRKITYYYHDYIPANWLTIEESRLAAYKSRESLDHCKRDMCRQPCSYEDVQVR